MTQPQIELLPCPACQASGEAVYEMTVYMNVKQIGCVACGLKGPSGSTQDAFDKWQAMPRPSPAVAPGLRDTAVDTNKIGDYLRRVVAQGIRNHTKDRDQANDQATRLLNWSDAGTDFLAILSDNRMTIAAARGGEEDL